jgi:tetratricopeptide (TPR) repeat protein
VEQPVGAAVRAKLDKTVIPQIAYDAIPLPEVLKMLTQDARRHGPDKRGVNLLTTRFFPDPPPGWHGFPVGPDGKPLPRLLDAKGNPIPDPQPPRVEPPDLDTVIINVSQVLNGLTLAQVLDVVCHTASRPITYRVEDYGVLITPKYPAPPVPKPANPPKPGASAPALTAPVAADVRRLQSNAEPGTRNEQVSQSLVTSAATDRVAAPDPLQAAQEEALRRQENRLVLNAWLRLADRFLADQSWTNAAARYEKCLVLARQLGGAGGVGLQFTNAIAGLTYARLRHATDLLEQGNNLYAREQVDLLFPMTHPNEWAVEFRKFVRAVAARKELAANLVETEREQVQARALALVAEGRKRFELGDHLAAQQQLEAAIHADPKNEAAFAQLRRVLEARFEKDQQAREQAHAERVVQVTRDWNEQLRSGKAALPVPNPYYRTNSQVPFLTHSSKGAQRINRKLEEIVLPEVHFDAVPLVGVVQRLMEDAKKFDPEKKGLNFLINDVSPAAPLLDAAGNPVPVARPVALSEGLVRVTQPLKNLTLRQALDVICKSAELPTQFSVEEYAIAFIPRGPVAYYSRIFRVSPDAFIQGLQGVVGSPVLGITTGGGNQPGATGQNQPATTTPAAPVRATVPATVPATQRTAAEANALVRQYFQSAGVTALGATNGSTRVTFNPENGLLLVRGTTNDLRVIEQAIQKVQPLPAPATNAATNSLPAPNPYYRTNSPAQPAPHSGKGAQRINAKLDEIILPEIHFDSVSLPAVVTWLDGNVKRHDPEKKGLNFLINNVVSDYIAPTGPVAPTVGKDGNQVVTPPRPPVTVKPDLENALVKVRSPIKGLTLRQALDAICMTAVVKLPDGRTTGLKFTVEEYAIVFSPKLPEQADLFSRIFKVDPETFITGLGSVVDEREVRPGSRAALNQALRERAWTNAPAATNRFSVAGVPVAKGAAGVLNTNVTAELNHLVRHYFTAAGVANLGVTNGPDATQVFFNDRNGLLLVRASLPDLDIIQQAIELLNAKPPQVLIEAKVVAMNQNDNKALGFDWFKPPGGQITSVLTVEQMAVVSRALEQRAATEIVPLPKLKVVSGKPVELEIPPGLRSKLGWPVGMKVEAMPTVAADGRSINLALVFPPPAGARQAVSQCLVANGQTMMVAPLHTERPEQKPSGVALFLTPTLVDSAGNRIHAPTNEPPFSPTNPAQPKPNAPEKK